MNDQKNMGTAGISIILGTYNRKKFLKKTIASIRKELGTGMFPSEIIVVDGGSNDGTLPWLMKQKDIITIVQHNRGIWDGKPIERKSWGYFMNLGFKCAQGKYICMLSDDCLVVPGAIVNGYNLFNMKLEKGERVGALAFYWREWPFKKTYMVSVSKNNKMFVNHGLFLRNILKEIDYIDEKNYSFYQADSDLCLRIWQKDYSVIESPDSYIEHYSHANEQVRSTNYEKLQSDRAFFEKRWKEYLGINPLDKEDPWTWIEKEYNDPYDTVKEFRLSHMLNYRLFITKVIRKIRKCLPKKP